MTVVTVSHSDIAHIVVLIANVTAAAHQADYYDTIILTPHFSDGQNRKRTVKAAVL